MDSAARQLHREAAKRFAPPMRAVPVARIGDMLGTRFGKQTESIHHPAKRKALFCTRRAGKTETAASYLLKAAAENPDCVCVFVGPTRLRAKALLWKTLKRFNLRFGFNGKVNESDLIITLDDGTDIVLTGADKLKDAEKKRGDRMALVMIDEASVYAPEVLAQLIDDVFGPALEDLPGVGTIVLMGTPGIVCAGYWYEATRNETDDSRAQRQHGWTVFEWSVLDNPFMAHMKERLPALKRERGWDDENPTYRREWLGRWVNDSAALFYRYQEGRNTYDTLPPGDWHHVVGVDLGFDDAFAYVVWAFCATSPVLYEVESYSESGLTPSEWFTKLEDVQRRFDPRIMRVDTGGLGKAIVEDAKKRHPSLPLEPAKKADKPGAVAHLNSDLVAGLVKVRAGSPLAAEWKRLPKDPDNELAEDSRFPNHCSDGGLYGHREARHFLGEVPTPPPPTGSREWAKAEEERMEEAAAREVRLMKAERDEELGFGFEAEVWEDDIE